MSRAALDHDFGPPFVDSSGNGDGIVCGLALLSATGSAV
jgi:hypothetical protein